MSDDANCDPGNSLFLYDSDTYTCYCQTSSSSFTDTGGSGSQLYKAVQGDMRLIRNGYCSIKLDTEQSDIKSKESCSGIMKG